MVPVHNEEARLPRCLDEFARYASKAEHDIEVIVAEDGSTDRTLDIAKEYGRKYHFVKIVSSKVRLGKGGGILNGIDASSGDIVLYMDVDMAVTLDQIPRFVDEILKGADVAIGSRTHPYSIVHKPPFHRIFLGRLFNILVRFMFRLGYFDTQVGFKAFKRKTLVDIIRQTNTDGFAFDVDVLIKSEIMGYKVREVPITWAHKRGSKISPIKNAYEMFFDLIRIKLELLANKRFTLLGRKEYKEFYDRIAGDVYHRAERSFFLPRRAWHVRKNREILQEIPGEAEHVLDLGSGSGNLTLKIALARPRALVTGIDIGKSFVKYSAQYSKKVGATNIDFIEGDINALPIREKFSPVVVVSEVLEYVPHQKSALAEINRVMKNQGLLILTTPRVGLRWAIIRAIWTLVRREKLEIPYFPLNLSRLRFLILGTGFYPLKLKVMNMGCTLLMTAVKVASRIT